MLRSFSSKFWKACWLRMKSVAARIRVVTCVFAGCLFIAALVTAQSEKTKWMPVKLCIELEYVLGIIVSLTGLFWTSFSMLIPFFNVDFHNVLCVIMILGLPLTSSSITRMLISEENIRFIQAAVNFTAFVYLLLTWGGEKDKKTKAQGGIEIVPGATVFSPSSPRRRYAKPKSLRQMNLAHRAKPPPAIEDPPVLEVSPF